MLCIARIHPPHQNLLKMYTYISKKMGHLIQTVLIFLLLWQGIKKENTADSLLRFLP